MTNPQGNHLRKNECIYKEMKKEQNGTQEKNQLIINNSNAESNSKKMLR